MSRRPLLSRLAVRLADTPLAPLPGERAHRQMLPVGRSYGDQGPSRDYRQSGVLILLIPENDGTITVPFIRREEDGGPHSGQIAFPGGGREPNDPDISVTALRESQEEIGLDISGVTVLGSLTPLYIDVSGYLIVPTVATWTGALPFPWRQLLPQAGEVAEIIPIPLCRIEQTQALRTVPGSGGTRTVPSYAPDDTVIWGATAMILAELLAVCAELSCCP